MGNDLEIDFKHWLRSGMGWSNNIEYGRGGQEGFPDVVGLVRSEMIPIECKTGSVKKGLWKIGPHPVLPSQVLWHTTYAAAGGVACLAIGVYDGEWSCLIIPSYQVINWKKGYKPLGKERVTIRSPDMILPTFESWLYYMKGR